jgi:hypothetical protein
MGARTLFLAWQDNQSRQWFPVGRLDADIERAEFRFRYTGGAERAQKEVGFPLTVDLPSLREDYRSAELFPLFKKRMMAPGRPDFAEHLATLDLRAEADPVEILAADGGHRVTDTFEVFPKIDKGADGGFRCRFFLHGWRYANGEAQAKLGRLVPYEGLHVALELTNEAAPLAVQIQTRDYHMIGWAPRYLVRDLMMAMAEGPGTCFAQVIRLNPLEVPSRQRLLIEMTGNWGSHEPMTDQDFEPLVE